LPTTAKVSIPKMPKATPMTMKRINRELADLNKEDLGDMTLAPNDVSLFEWKATIPGPSGSVYEGGLFHVDISLPDDYPFSAPRATFVTKIYHMNISERGQVCVDLLKHNWSPALSLFKVMLSLSSLLTDPNPKDPLVPSIATQYNRQRALHDTTARQWVQLYALPNQVSTSSSAATAPTTLMQRPTQRRGRMPQSLVAAIAASPRSRRGNQSSSSTPITISDDESSAPTTRKRKVVDLTSNGTGEPSTSGRQRRKVTTDSSVIVIDD